MTRVLYVEDEPFLAKIVKETLETKGYEIELVSDGAEAVPMFKRSEFDVCVLDIMLPNLNGYDIAHEIRTIDPHVPIIFLTAKDQTKDLLKGFASGGNDYIRKPFSIEELIARMENLIALSKGERQVKEQTDVKLGSRYIFSPKRLELRHEHQTIQLSHRESQILKILSSNQNGVSHRKRILLEVWGDDSFYNSRNLDVYIRKLRKYLGEDPLLRIITLKGVGYQFLVDQQ